MPRRSIFQANIISHNPLLENNLGVMFSVKLVSKIFFRENLEIIER